MPRTAGEMKRSRQLVRRTFTERCDISRMTVVPSQGPGEPDEAVPAAHLTDVPCRYIPGEEREVERGGRVITIRTAVVTVPYGTDVKAKDLITEVRDIERNPRTTNTLSILGVDRYDAHYACVCEELS